MVQNSEAKEQDAQGRTKHQGVVVGIRGTVVDVEFERGLPEIHHALEIDWDGPHRLVVEVQQHLDDHTVRGVALAQTSGLARGASGSAPERATSSSKICTNLRSWTRSASTRFWSSPAACAAWPPRCNAGASAAC